MHVVAQRDKISYYNEQRKIVSILGRETQRAEPIHCVHNWPKYYDHFGHEIIPFLWVIRYQF